VTLPRPQRLSNRAIIGFGLVLCVVVALLLAWYLGVFV
jgi:hypothetical protein